ncbi:MAG: methionyl-tRNA formyltransferase [Acidobacteria bacterium]|nr:methionyl-tRNA formyltransferase [Acidobacteriota bacterium]
MRLLFLGTPDFAVPALDAVAREHEIVLVVAQPDKPSGRGMQLHAPPVALRARELGLPLMQPAKVRDPQFLEELAKAAPEAGVVIAYGKILPPALLAIPPRGLFNIHASILPYYRGAAPIQRAIEQGERTTGVSIMRVDEQLDHGPVLATDTTPIGPEERTPSLSKRLSLLGAEAMVASLREIERGTAVETLQDHERATYAAKIEKQEGAIDWRDSAETIFNRFRAFDPWPGIFLTLPRGGGEEMLKLNEVTRTGGSAPAGEVLAIDSEGVVVACGTGALRILIMQRPGKPRANGADVARGLGWHVGGQAS